jgi:hypothetical protein|tara:strand:- start:76 stop:315 length:240 start_codon:yes stop_codon:yes gene_type:complete
MNQVIIHMKKSALDHIKELQLFHIINDNEIDVIVDDIEYRNGNHPDQNGIWEDPDVQLCNDYGINYDLVNMIELDEVPA